MMPQMMPEMVTVNLVATVGAVALFAGAMVLAAVMDVATMEVSDRLVMLLLAGYLVLAPASGWSFAEMAWSVAAALLVFFSSVAFFSLGWMGGGDGKLATVGALWLGAENTLAFVMMTALMGGLCALAVLAVRRLSLPSAWLDRPWLARLRAPEAGIPYAVAIGSAGLILLANTPWAAGLP